MIKRKKVASVCLFAKRHETSVWRCATVRLFERFHLPKSHPASLRSNATTSITFSQLLYVLK